MVEKNKTELVTINIELELETLSDINELFGSVNNATPLQVCNENVEIQLISAGDTLSFDGGMIAEILLSFSVGVASGIIGNFIFSSLCKGAKKLKLNKHRTRITEESITQVIEITKTTTVKRTIR